MIPLRHEWGLTRLKGGNKRSTSYKCAKMGRSLGHWRAEKDCADGAGGVKSHLVGNEVGQRASESLYREIVWSAN